MEEYDWVAELRGDMIGQSGHGMIAGRFGAPRYEVCEHTWFLVKAEICMRARMRECGVLGCVCMRGLFGESNYFTRYFVA